MIIGANRVEDKLHEPLDDFKKRELEIINLMADGLSNQEIADQLFIAVGTVRWYNKQIYSKLGTSRRTEAIALARQMGLIEDGTSGQETVAGNVNHLILPVTTGPFIGRDQELGEITNLLEHPDVHLVSIIGAGGMGKSRLSLEVGHLIHKQYTHGAAFIDLAVTRNPNDIAQLTVSSIGLTVNSTRQPEDVLFDYCREKELLLIFDNAEHVLGGMDLLADILKHASAVKIIVTSRARLNLRVETTYFLEPVIEQGHALFVEVSTLMHPRVAFSETDRPYIDKVVELVGGLPLALVLAATWVDMLPIPEIVEEIQQSLDFLQAEMADMPERQRSIRSVIDPTWKRLSEKEQHAFMWASVFRGGFTREAFQDVTSSSIRTLQTLLNRSLISHGYERRYAMHPLVRQYAREKLDDHHMLHDAKNKHLETLMTYAQTHAEHIFSGRYLESLDALEREADNIRAALDWSLQGNNIEQGVAIILANGEFWLARSRVQEAITYVEKAIELSDHPKLFYWQATYLDRLGHIDRSIEAAHHLIAYSEANQDYEMLAYGQFRLGITRNKLEATPLFTSALSNALKTENQHLIANCHNYLSFVDSEQFSIDDPRSHNQQALKIFESLGDLHGISRVTNNIAIQYYDDRRIQEAQELMDYSLQLKREIGDQAGEARRLTTLSMWAMAEEGLEQAQEWLGASREICEELGELERLSYVLSTEGLLYMLMMDFEAAQSTLERNLQIDIDIQDDRGIVDIYCLLCQLHLLQNNPTKARFLLQKAIDAIKHDQSQPALLIIVYANYLWYKHELNACVPIVATIAGRELNTYVGSNLIVNNYLLQPLVHRVRQHIDDEAWQQAIEKRAGVTFEHILQDIMNEALL